MCCESKLHSASLTIFSSGEIQSIIDVHDVVPTSNRTEGMTGNKIRIYTPNKTRRDTARRSP